MIINSIQSLDIYVKAVFIIKQVHWHGSPSRQSIIAIGPWAVAEEIQN